MKNKIYQDTTISTVTRVEIWNPTCLLRWKIKDIDFDMINKQKILQQMWQSDMGKQEWKDVSFAEEVIPKTKDKP